MRIYLDKNIFSNIRNKDSYKELADKINEYKENNDFYYSYAHILDLQKDKTTKKFDDLTFIGKITNNNYLLREWKKSTNSYIVEPIEAFNSADSDIDVNEISKLANLDQFLGKKNYLQEQLATVEFPDSIDNQYPEYMKNILKIFSDQKEDFDFEKLIKDQMLLSNELKENSSIYKEMRRFNRESQHLFLNKDTNSRPESIDDFFENSILGSTLLEYAEKNIFVEPLNEDEKKYHMYVTAYFTLNMLGLDSEKNKKASFNSIFNDAMHSYYSGYCDVVVSEDNGFIKKTNYLFKLFNIDALVCKPDDFIKYIDKAIKNEVSFNEIQNCVNDDMKKMKICYQQQKDNNYIIHLLASSHYLYIFKKIQIDLVLKQDKMHNIKTITLFPGKKMGTILPYNEVAKVVNHCIQLLGEDYYGIGSFSKEEIEEINEEKWKGRHWLSNNGFIHLSMDKIKYIIYLCLYINENHESP